MILGGAPLRGHIMALMGVLAWVGGAHAHKLDPARADILADGNQFRAVLYVPAGWSTSPTLESDTQCTRSSVTLQCAEFPGTLRVSGLERDQQVLVTRSTSVLGVLTVSEPELRLDRQSSWSGSVWLGVIHVLGGWDHVAFLLALLLWVSSLRCRLVAITAFTVGHSVTLAAVAFGFEPWSSEATELLIGVSVVLLAIELSSGERAVPPTRLELAITVTGIGLIHGLGFGGVLLELGATREDATALLFGFNVGIEVGQLALFVVWWGLERLMGAASQGRGAMLRTSAVWGLGVVGAYWTIDRLWGWLDTFA